MIYSTVKTQERATELVMAKAKELGLVNGGRFEYKETITVECGNGDVQAIQFNNLTENVSITCAFDDACGDDDAFESDVLVIR